ncbi:hypothetical protein ELE36_01450 [Pseudolysobacter antarcticus]|uniref:ABC-type transport auxiliary lipoprotein component domain-containing protein n=1 Tax=Pseudolysobacter antarcticus TaxID=2511995 RepID=A0A411HF86_9GAMM|nr:hypothetical protein [Pseudolysobacter antarcticus]QBB69150.1 hypothetical protein ELE36_01450 [Pseudolysobacter antarcticus]
MKKISIAGFMRAGCLLALVSMLAACVSAPPKQAYNREANTTIKRIDILPMPNSEVGLDILNNPGYSFGLIGLAIAEANMAPKRNWIEAQVRQGNFDHVAIFRERLTQAMAAKGYELVWPTSILEDAKKPASRDKWGYRQSYAADANAEAQLDLAIRYVGYASAGSSDSAPYRPTVALSAKLVSRDGKTALMVDQIIYNPVFPNSQSAITINADPAYTYPEFNALQASGAKALDGLRKALESTADELAKQY